ncbi:MAG: arsenate reductase ArsC [Thiobacillus sp.]|nr:arsenate reductase ArsC [Thiobacillus sp.]
MNTLKVYNVLFLCTGNSARSIMAESILNAQSAGRFRAYSAGSHSVGSVNPQAIELLQRNHYKTDSLRSKSWDEFAAPGAPVMDFVFTVCDQAAAEVCPVWPGEPISAHWGVADPAAVTGTEEQRHRAFNDAFSVLSRRISIFMCLPIEKLSRLALQQEVSGIGRVVEPAPSTTSA